ncbi:hydantoinase B/oxoprolinase family protein [Amycolatopsis jejuensis]|uniref:hydantoinase B/oxoprolinase family protein n=1 Tax=Amycolatopsis jejuensis TaxID=330084 RepID=UPI0005273E89|nr:hydantoinase B/oxoprolinase family protein [Amycolatopsis jejuensis]
MSAADPVTTEIIHYGLEAAADQMRQTLVRTAFSAAIYDVLDFGAALYDRDIRLLAQAKSMPGFLGTLGFAAAAMVERAGGAETLREGDVLFSTYGYDIGSHAPDAVVLVPGFFEGELIGYAVIKAHQADIGAKEPYCTDSTDIFQEGVIFPGVRLYSAGERNEDIYRTVLANSRLPQAFAGDLAAQIGSANVGLREVGRLLRRYGRDRFTAAVDSLFGRGEQQVRDFLATIPDGTYRASGAMDDNGVETDPVPISVTVEVRGSDICIDLTDCADQQRGPVNSPRASTEGGMRLAVLTLAGVRGAVNDGCFRPITVRTRPGSVLDPLPPAPIFLYHWSWPVAMDLVHRALADAVPDAVPAASGGDMCGVSMWGFDARGALWTNAAPHGIGMGASARGDMTTPLIFMPSSGFRPPSVESQELGGHLLVERLGLAPDSGGAGRYRGGLGVDGVYRTKDPQFLVIMAERTRTRPWGLHGGAPARANSVRLRLPDGTEQSVGKASGLPVPPGTVIEAASGGGGGFGPAAERDRAAVHRDLREGYVTPEAARRDYPQVFDEREER